MRGADTFRNSSTRPTCRNNLRTRRGFFSDNSSPSICFRQDCITKETIFQSIILSSHTYAIIYISFYAYWMNYDNDGPKIIINTVNTVICHDLARKSRRSHGPAFLAGSRLASSRRAYDRMSRSDFMRPRARPR